MITVFVWHPDEQHVGHAALMIDSIYVSFWPDGDATKKDLKIKRSHPGAWMRALQDDIQNEGNRQPDTVHIRSGFDESVLIDHIERLRTHTPRYQLARYNCSHVVAECLLVACCRKPSFTPCAREYSQRLGKVLGHGIWTPRQVLQYARELA